MKVSAARAPTRPAAGRPARRQRYRPRQTTTPTDDRRQTTDTSVQNNTGPLGGPVIKKKTSGKLQRCSGKIAEINRKKLQSHNDVFTSSIDLAISHEGMLGRGSSFKVIG